MKSESILRMMYIITAVFVCIALTVSLVMLFDRSELKIVWREDPNATVTWADDINTVQEKLDAVFPERTHISQDPSNQILPNFPTLVNINTAETNELCKLPGIGIALAEKIIEDRTVNGPFDSVDDITRVSGIGEKKLDGFRDLITVRE